VKAITLDLETILDPAMPARKDDGFAPAPYWKIACMSVVIADIETLEVGRIVSYAGDERDTLTRFTSYVAEETPVIYTYNGRGFDLPVIEARCMRYGIDAGALHKELYRSRYRGPGHVDLIEKLSNDGASRRSNLESWARLCGLPGKMTTTGSDVAALVAAGNLEAVNVYCEQDAAQTWAIALRWNLCTGSIVLTKYREGARSLMQALLKNEDHCAFVEAIDRRTFLLEEA
jgi:predicted PolB exonuclease-like 3'-5' exonuclease